MTLPETVDAVLAADLVERLPDGLAYGYWDMAHPSPSDPGAHTYLWRDAQGLALGLGNHGWSTKASRLGADEAALHLQIALAGARAQGEPRLVLCVADFPWLLGRGGRVAKRAHKTLRARLEAMRDQRASAGR